MKNLIVSITLLIVIIVLSGCPKPCIEANYSFVVHSQITPDIDSINIGDTIFLISLFPSMLKDQNTSAQVNYSSSTGIASTLAVNQLLATDSLAKDAVFDFDYVSIKGRIYNDRNIPRPEGVQQITWEELNGNYELKIGLIPKVSGLYVLVVGNGISNGQKKDRNCSKATFNITLENTDQHFYLLYNWDPDALFYNDGKSRVYYFKVK